MKKILILMFVCCIFNVNAADRYWVGGVGGTSWSSTANWSATTGGASGATAPGANDRVYFDNGLSVSVNYDIGMTQPSGFADFKVSNNTNLTLTNTTGATRNMGINGTSTTYYTVVTSGSSLTLKSNASFVFSFYMTAGRAIFDGSVSCINSSVNTANGPKLDATSDSIIINNLFYTGPQITQTGSTSGGAKYRFGPNSIYQMDRNGGVTLAGKYAPTALIKLTGTTSTAPTFAAGTNTAYGSIEIATTIASGALNLGFASGASIQGFFKITSSNGQIIRFATTPPTPFSIGGDVIVNDGTLQPSNSSTAVVVNIGGNLEVAASKTFDIQPSSGNNTIKVAKNITINGILTESGSSTLSILEMVGPLTQILSCAGTVTNDVSLKINNSAGATCPTDVNWSAGANAKVTMTAGNFNMGANTFYIQNGTTTSLAGGVLASHFIGKLRRVTTVSGGAYVFPVSDNAADLATVKIYPVSASNYTVNFVRPNPYSRTAVTAPIVDAGNYIWDITQNTGTGADLNFNYGNFANGGVDAANVKGLHWNGASWDTVNGADAGGNSVDVTGVTAFSPFSVGNTTTSLPISLKSFSATATGTSNLLSWETAIEQNVRTFIIEKSDNSKDWTALDAVRPNPSKRYEMKDNTPYEITYYRLKNVDNDGREQVSKVVSVQRQTGKFNISSIAPNPTFGDLAVNFENNTQSDVTIQVLDIFGKIIFTQNISSEKGLNNTSINTSNLVAGSYFLNMNNGVTNLTQRFVKQ